MFCDWGGVGGWSKKGKGELTELSGQLVKEGSQERRPSSVEIVFCLGFTQLWQFI